MKFLVPVLLLIGLTGCSRSNDQPSVVRQLKLEPVRSHRYLVTFAAVKVPNELLQSYMTNSTGRDSIKERYRIAGYLLAHTNEFSIILPEGNFVPLVATGRATGGRFVIDNKKEVAELEKTGIKITRLAMNVDVKEEDNHESVWYDGMISYNVDVSSTGGVGGGITFPGGMLPIGQADLQPLYEGKRFTLCALVKLNRAE